MRNNGFTLIEMIIVIAIIAIISAVSTLSINAPSYSRFLAEAEKIAATFSALSDDAIYSSSVLACTVTTNSISCNRYRDGEWHEFNLQKELSWDWPRGMQIQEVLINGTPLKDKQQIKFLPSGDNDSLSIHLTNGEHSAWIDSDLAGRYKVSS